MRSPNPATRELPAASSLRHLATSVRMALAATVLAGAASASSQVLTDPGLDSDSQPILSWSPTVLDRWLQENATFVTGTQGDGAAPFAGDGMVRMAKAGGSATQVRQRVDVSALATSIDAGLVVVEARGMLNPSVSGVIVGVQAHAHDASGSLITFANSSVNQPDGDVSTWEEYVAELVLPAGTRFVEFQIAGNNPTLPSGQFIYADSASLDVFVLLAPLGLTDPGLDSNSQSLLNWSPTVLDRWLQENAVLVTGTQGDGAAPFAGDGMLRMSKAGGSATQVRQRLDVSAFATSIDQGIVTMESRGMLNPSVSGVIVGVQAHAHDASGSLITFANSSVNQPDGDVSTWEEYVAELILPAGTRFVEFQFAGNNPTLPSGQFIYADEASVTLKAAPVCFTDAGPALAGVFGDPQLAGHVSLGPNAVGNLLLTNALQSTPAALFVGLGPAGPGVPFKGGTLVPVPWLLLLDGLVTDTSGEIDIPLNFGLGLGGFSLVFQYGILDGAAVNGISLSNAEQLDLL